MSGVLRRVGRWLAPLLDPDAPERTRREQELMRRVAELSSAMARQSEQVGAVSKRVETFDRTWPSELRRSVTELQRQVQRQANVARRLAQPSLREREIVRERVFRRLAAVGRRDGHVLIGPWTGEVGFELLYWAPFVRFVLRRFRIAPERVTIVSRGGTASWYGVDGASYLDVFDLTTPDEFRASTAGEKKQRGLRVFDRRLLRAARARVGGSPVSIVHPALMYSLYMPYWKQQESVKWVTDAATFTRIEPPRPDDLRARLPQEYVAARFYFSDCFPDTPGNRTVVASLLQSLSAEVPVVLLGPGTRFDEHYDVDTGTAGRIVSIEDAMRPETNLAVQTAVIAGARAFVGTYGGFSYLAPLCGVPALALYSVANYFAHHLEMARMVFDQVGAAPFTSVDVATLPLLRHAASGQGTPVH